MRLYHFTWSGWVGAIHRQGILPGDVPVFPGMTDPDPAKRGLPDPNMNLTHGVGVSLTGDPSFERQNWSQGSTVNKTDCRICVEVPDDDKRLLRWVDICRSAIKEYGDQLFPVPRVIERDDSGRMVRDEHGDPVVKQYADGKITLRHWYGILNEMGDYRAWYIWNGTVPPEWIQSVAARDEAVVAETPAMTPAGAIAYVEELAGACLTIPGKIADASTKPEGDTWSEKGVRSMANLIQAADLFLWRAPLFRAAGRGADAFDGTPFDIEMPRDGVVFVPDRRMTAHRNEPDASELAIFDALLMYPIEKREGRFFASHTGKDYSWHPDEKGRGDLRETRRSKAKEAPDGKYIAGLLIRQTQGIKPTMEADLLETMADIADNKLAAWDPDANLVIRALPMMGLGQACEGWGSLIQALFKFMDQKIVGVERQGPPRPERRRMKRAKMPIWEVKVISLRRYQQGTGIQVQAPGGTIDWQCQWTVSGHWRKQPYPAKGTVEVIWIEPYIKGPEDKPLRDPTKSIFSVRR